MSAFQRWSLWLTSLGTGLTGVLYWWMDTLLTPVDEWAVINHPLQPWILKAHIVAAPLLVFAVGLITAGHVWKHYRSGVRRARRTGLTVMFVFAPMVMSGYLVQAVTHATWLRAMVWAHLLTGALYLAGLALHWWVLRGRGGRPAPPEAERREGRPAPVEGGGRLGQPVLREADRRLGQPAPPESTGVTFAAGAPRRVRAGARARRRAPNRGDAPA